MPTEHDKYEREWRDMRKKSNGELLQMKFTGDSSGNNYMQFLIDMEFDRRKFVRDVMIDRIMSGAAIIISLAALIYTMSRPASRQQSATSSSANTAFQTNSSTNQPAHPATNTFP